MKLERRRSSVRRWFVGVVVAFLSACGASDDHDPAEAPSPPPNVLESPSEGNAEAEARPEVDPLPPSPSEGELAEAWWVEGRVIRPPGTPAGAQVTVVAKGRRFKGAVLHSDRIDDREVFRVAFAKRTRTASIGLESDWLLLNASHRIELSATPEAATLEPLLGGRIEGTIRFAEGTTPEPERFTDAEVKLEFLPQGDVVDPRQVLPRFGTVTAEGKFSFDALFPGAIGKLSLRVPGYVPIERGGLPIEAGRLLEEVLTLVPGVSVSGRVVDEEGAPIARASVSRSWISGTVNPHGDRTATNEKGEFHLTGLVPGPLGVTAEKSGYSEAEVALGALNSGDSRTEVVLTLPRGIYLEGTVLWPEGEPAAKAWIEITPVGVSSDPFPSSFVMVEEIRADEQGRFLAGGLEPGPYDVEARARRRDPAPERNDGEESARSKRAKRAPRVTYRARMENVGENTSGLVLVLSRGERIAGHAVDEAGKPVVEFAVQTERRDGLDQEKIGLGLSSIFPHATKFESKEGEFALEGLLPGVWSLTATAPGYAHSEAVEIVVPMGDGRVRLVLRRPGVIAGSVVDDRGVPHADARIIAEREDDSASGVDVEATTDGDGSFVVDGLSPGTWTLHARAAGYAPSEVEERRVESGEHLSGVDLRLRRGATIRGVVLGFDDRPASHVEVEARRHRPYERRSARTDAEGRFGLADLAPGEWRLESKLSAEEMMAFPTDPLFEDGEHRSRISRKVEVELSAGEDVDLVLRAEAETMAFAPPPPEFFVGSSSPGAILVRGRITVAGEAATYASLDPVTDPSGSPRDRWYVQTSEDGAYEVRVEHAGSCTIWVKYGEAVFSKTVEIPEVEEHELDLVFDGGTITGWVLDEAGAPVPNARISAEPTLGHLPGLPFPPFGIGTNAEGRYEMKGLVPADYDVRAVFRDPQGSRDRRRIELCARAVRVLPDAVTEVETLTLEGKAELIGRVFDDADRPVSKAKILVWSGDGYDTLSERPRTDEAGRFRIRGLPPGPTRVLAWKESSVSHESVLVELTSTEPRAVDLRLRPGTMLEVAGTGYQGNLVLSSIDLHDERGFDFGTFWDQGVIPLSLVSHEAGRAQVGPLPPGTYLLYGLGLGAEDDTVRVVVNGEAFISVDLQYR
jgi:protocatechuate 3,4-dioxygenase beta subunit